MGQRGEKLIIKKLEGKMINTRGNRKALKNFSLRHANIGFPVIACKCYCCSNLLLFEIYHDGFTIFQLTFLYVGFILRESGFGIKMGICIICRRYIYIFCNTLYQDADIPHEIYNSIFKHRVA